MTATPGARVRQRVCDSTDELGRLGYRIVLYANTAMRPAARAMQEGLAVLRREGTSASPMDRPLLRDERQRLVDLNGYRELAARYGEETLP
jgi:2-methylisocitrate lyase-like PEP mutase family enzyme